MMLLQLVMMQLLLLLAVAAAAARVVVAVAEKRVHRVTMLAHQVWRQKVIVTARLTSY